ncbi:hypothetical protein B0O80DRAFT_35223 [Mortierella sp. GBAus27b]|nr:hypothetical protein B0O80DRAFT_35223 [Mortierella sp. GBAus27b]
MMETCSQPASVFIVPILFPSLALPTPPLVSFPAKEWTLRGLMNGWDESYLVLTPPSTPLAHHTPFEHIDKVRREHKKRPLHTLHTSFLFSCSLSSTLSTLSRLLPLSAPFISPSFPDSC